MVDSDNRFALIGAHLREEDVANVEGVTVLAAGGLVLSALAFEAVRGIADRQVIGEVATARAALIRRELFVAIRYGISVRDSKEASDKCTSFLDRWRELLTQFRGCIEMTLKIASPGSGSRPDSKQFQSGSDYLRELHRSRSAKSLDAPVREMIERELFPLSLQRRWVARQDGGIELAFLMQRDRLDSAAAFATRMKEHFPELPFLLSGPWPLEIFANDEQ